MGISWGYNVDYISINNYLLPIKLSYKWDNQNINPMSLLVKPLRLMAKSCCKIRWKTRESYHEISDHIPISPWLIRYPYQWEPIKVPAASGPIKIPDYTSIIYPFRLGQKYPTGQNHQPTIPATSSPWPRAGLPVSTLPSSAAAGCCVAPASC